MQRQRDGFIDIVKIYACILVVLGHFFQSMVSSEIILASDFILWFDKTIYYFHVPLFFMCSGYLFQKYSKVTTFSQWGNNFLKKALAFSVPYFVFSTATWVLKTVFSSSVNEEAVGYFRSMFLEPISPYWYLYALFFVFLITPTFKNKKVAVAGLISAFVLKVVSFFVTEMSIYAVSTLMHNEIWFVGGMCISCFELPAALKKKAFRFLSISLSLVFVVSSIVLYVFDIKYASASFVMGIIACIATFVIAVNVENVKVIKTINSKLSKYTLPVFLMHTIFAAGFRAVLLKLGITNVVVHIVCGLAISFFGPILTAFIMSKVKWLDFVLYPNKYIKIKSRG
ncbi:MAG: acyltransferase family protein [Ruminococcus sp.]|nr:acyltransferase family protein [Ruminococcus sp.]